MSIREVAKQAGVSVGTVSNVLNNPGLVAEIKRRRVERAIDELGFVRNNSARQLRVGHSNLIGLVVLNVSNPFSTEVARGVEDAANAADHLVVLCNSGNSIGKEAKYLQALQEHRARGVLIMPAQTDVGYLERWDRQGLRTVLLTATDPSQGLCSVSADDVHGGELATAHLLEQGHERIGFVHGPLRLQHPANKRRGVLRAVERAGLDPSRVLYDVTTPTQSAVDGELCVEELLHARPRPTAVFCANDFLALGLMRGLAKRQVRVPEDLVLVGYDDVEFAVMLSPPLTSVRQPKYRLGRTAAELLFAQIDSGDSIGCRQIVFQPELIVRESSHTST